MKRPDRYFAFLLGLLPASFRERHGDELGPLLERMKDELGPSPSRLALLRLYVAATWDLIRQSPGLSRDARGVSESRARRWGRGGFSLVDVKLGVRMLGKQPLLTGVAMLALGLGIPASLSVFHVMRVMLSPLPVPEGERVMGIRHWDRELSDPVLSSVHDLAQWRESLGGFSSIGAVRSYMLNVYAGETGAPPVRGAEVTASTFRVLRAAPLLGRLLGPEDGVRGAPDVVILGEDLWTARFARDPGIVGRTVRIGRRQHTVVGVMPSEFRFPLGEDVWLPLRASPVDHALGEGPGVLVFGRLADGVTKEEAGAEMALVTARQAADHPEIHGQHLGEVVKMPILLLRADVFSTTDPDLLLGQALISILLLIVCGNVGILLLARSATRMGELSIRTALGASRIRIVGQLFIEALVLSVLATGLGLVAAEGVARAMTRILRTVMPDLPYWIDLGLDSGTVLAALGLAAFCAVLAGVAPALKVTGGHVQANLQRLASGASSLRFGIASTLLIVTEVGLSVGFLALGATLVRSAFQDREGRLGLEPERYVTATLRRPWRAPAGTTGDQDEAAAADHPSGDVEREVLRRLLAEDAVRGAGIGVEMPGSMPGGEYIALEVEGEAESHRVGENRVDVGFFRGLNRPILAGRDFAETDLEAEADASGRRPAVIVNTSFVEQVLGGRSPVGQRFRPYVSPQYDTGERMWFEIVGVVGPFGMNPSNPSRDAGFYLVAPAGELKPTRYLVEVAGEPAAFLPRFREIVASVDPEATLEAAMPVAEVMAVESTFDRLVFAMELALAGIAFLLSVSGLYALMSFTVSQRTREIGIRTALGARPLSIVSTIGRRAALQLGAGVALGGVWAWLLLDQITHDVEFVDAKIPLTVAVTVVAAVLVGMAACASPTLRGLRIEPSEALRES